VRRLARLLIVAGYGAAVLGLSKAHAVANAYDYTASFRFSWSLAYIGLLIVAAYGAGLPDLTRTRRSAVLAAVGSTAAAALGISVVQLIVGSAVLPRFVIFGAAVLLVPFAVLCATLAQDGHSRDGQRDRVVAVARFDEGVYLTAELAAHPERPAVLISVLSPESASVTRPGEYPLLEAVRAADANAVVLDRTAQSDDSIVAQAAELHEAGIRVRTLSLFYEQWLGKLPLSELERVSLFFDIGEVHRARYGRMKRILDGGLALLGVAALGVTIPFVLLGNRLGNRGPLFYRQSRVGKSGREFSILKFRTMRSDNVGSTWTTEGDPRITPFGNWLRRTHLDELPQVLNILRGDLAFVGPRPEQPLYVAELTGKIPFYRLRHLVRPGLTGWAQVKYPYGASDLDAFEKLQYEFFYLRRQSLAFDLRILSRTLRTVMGRTGR
jgi:lipopolysaccharide/colanic/teichoic acid biosynthesis glycosyltransferase